MEELEHLHKKNCMTNTEKTIAMSFHTKKIRNSLKPQATFNSMDIVCKPELKFLGICHRNPKMICPGEVIMPKIK